MTFSPWTGAPHLRALGERDGVLFAVGDNFIDHFALASSADGGATWHKLLTFDQICGPLACPNIQQVCAVPWAALRDLFMIAPNTCGQGGAGGAAGGSGGCGCWVGAQGDRPVALGAGAATLLALAGLAMRPARGRRRRSRIR
jgi:hypothetical protein